MVAIGWGEQHSYREEKPDVGWVKYPGSGDGILPAPSTPGDFQECSKGGPQWQRVGAGKMK